MPDDERIDVISERLSLLERQVADLENRFDGFKDLEQQRKSLLDVLKPKPIKPNPGGASDSS